MKLIINADDCGKNQEVNSAIESFINAGKITSTTVIYCPAFSQKKFPC